MPARGTLNAISVAPYNFVMCTTETLVLGFDFTAVLVGGQAPSTPTFALVDVTSPQNPVPITLTDGAGVVGNVCTQKVRGPTQLAAQHTFTLTCVVAVDVNNTWTAQQEISCPQ